VHKVPIPQSAIRVANPGFCKRDRIAKRQLDLQSVTVEALISFFHVQLLAGYIAGPIQPRLAAQTDWIDDKRVSFPMANGMSHEGIFQLFRRRVASSIHPDLPYRVIALVKDHHAAWCLYDLVSANTDSTVVNDQHRRTVRDAVLGRIQFFTRAKLIFTVGLPRIPVDYIPFLAPRGPRRLLVLQTPIELLQKQGFLTRRGIDTWS